MSDGGCLGCQKCEDGPVVTLIDGRTVCNTCPDWRNECEARYLLDMPLSLRQESLARRSNLRGADAVGKLKAALTALHEARRLLNKSD